MESNLTTKPYSDGFISDFVGLSELAFGRKAPQTWVESASWRLTQMPETTVFATYVDSELIGFKAGYATAYDRYYSWLGAVHPDHRCKGVGGLLMRSQHDWLTNSRFRLLETQVSRSNRSMISLNRSFDFVQSGEFLKDGEPYLIFEKKF